MPARIAIFASGSGSNAEAIALHALKSNNYKVALIVTNNPSAGVIVRGHKLGIPVLVLSPKTLNGPELPEILKKWNISHISLAGFLKLISPALLDAYENRIVNIHPALLPKYGGKGMYGSIVHESIIRAGESQSGITIHLVNREYDKGQILFQAICPVLPDDNAETLAERIHGLEHKYYPVFLDHWVQGLAITPNLEP